MRGQCLSARTSPLQKLLGKDWRAVRHGLCGDHYTAVENYHPSPPPLSTKEKILATLMFSFIIKKKLRKYFFYVAD